MSIKQLFFIILLIVSVGRIAIAEDKKEVFQPIKAGETAPFDGYLFTSEAIVKIYTKSKEEVRLAKLEAEHSLELAQIEIQKLMDLSQSESRIQAKLLQDTINAKDEVIQQKLDIITKLENRNSANSYKVVGAFVTGALITFTLVYFTADMLR